jgi:hypothetical protein
MVEYCSRCGRQAPSVDSAAYIFWTVTAADDLVCPDCANPEAPNGEQQQDQP